MIYILGLNSFIGKHLYIKLKTKHNDIILLTHTEISMLKDIKEDDILINCCGVNRGSNKQDFDSGNFYLVKKIVESFKETPYLIHLSSLMVHGFKNTSLDELSEYQRWFIESKIKGDNFLINNYNKDKLCIVRPSNIYGYDCKPYYNNILSTLVYEKINNFTEIKSLNKNCIRNMLSIESLVEELTNIIDIKKTGVYNITSTNNLTLENIINNLYETLPKHINIIDGESSIPNIIGETTLIEENFVEKLEMLYTNMKNYYNLLDFVDIKKRNCLHLSKGDMVEISSLEARRLYKISISKNSVRGNHFHYKQIEEFYINNGKVIFLLAFNNNTEIIHYLIGNKNDVITIKPGIIHTVCNDFKNNIPEIIISSTQKYIPNQTPDTEYLKIL